MKKNKKAVVLLSGGLDSSTLLYYAKSKGYDCHCLIFDYGQKHRKEIGSAKKVAASAGFPYTVLKADFPTKKSSLLNRSEKIPVHKDPLKTKSIPSTYVPGRNTVFLSHSLSLAESTGASAIFIGANAIDFSGYPDCRPVYYSAFNNLIRSLGLNISIITPLLYMDKSQIVKLGTNLGVPFELTWSCYKGNEKPCGACDSCKFRMKGFSLAGISDPLIR